MKKIQVRLRSFLHVKLCASNPISGITTVRARLWSLMGLLGFVMGLPVWGQAPELVWSTSVGARAFAMDNQSNVYASTNGTVIKLSAAGVPLQTNSICPRPGLAQRDPAGNVYFAGNFDGFQ